MSSNFFNLPRELRDRINELVLLHQELIDPWVDYDSVGILANIRSGCANLSTLTTSLYSTNAMEPRLDALDNPKVVTESLRLVNTYFRAISFLQEIMVEVYEDGPSDHIRRKTESHGWTISVAEYMEEENFDRSLGDFEYDDYGYDSDFWRRAAD